MIRVMLRKTHLLWFLVFVLAVFLRFYRLATVPSILNRDEAALAYNAALLQESGKDEWGISWPLLFRSFGDYKLPGYIYTLFAVFQIFPKTDFFVRLPSALAGVFLVYLLVIFAKNILKWRQETIFFLAFLGAVLPVTTFFSRMAFEANLALTLLFFSFYLLWLPGKKAYFALPIFLLAALTYNTPLLLSPAFILLSLFLFWQKKEKKYFFLSLGFLGLAGLLFFLFSPLTAQKSAITLFQDPTVWTDYLNYRSGLDGFSLQFFGSKYVYYFLLMAQNFFKSLSWQFLVTQGGSHPWHSVPFWGHMYASSYFLALSGALLLLRKTFLAIRKKTVKTILPEISLLFFSVASLAPAVITVDAPHATRSLLFFVCLTLLAAFAFQNITALFSRKVSRLLKIAFWLVLISESISYQWRYFQEYPQMEPAVLWPEYRQEILELTALPSETKIAVLDGEGYQYILTAWYAGIPAEEFFSSIERSEPDSIHFSYGETLGRFHFIRQRSDRGTETILLSQEKGLETL